MSGHRLIKLLGEPIQTENDKAAAAITPGMVVDFDVAGNLVPHATAAAPLTPATFAMEREEMGTTIDVPYAIGDQVKVGFFYPGCHVHALLAPGENVVKGDLLESAGDGTLQAATLGAFCRALEAIDNSLGADAVRVRTEIV